MLVENKSDLNKAGVKVEETKISRVNYAKYNLLDRKRISAKHQRSKINAMMLELLRRIHDNKDVKQRNKVEQFIIDEDYVKKKKKAAATRACCGGGGEVEEEIIDGGAPDKCVIL
eukprot:TRINITY_DN816_c0_g1_i2.p2 TRINITY_DN816_c0_g1~~TRINITY_DN816_c0_g1_i2.p2  ORF type:complete len:115 (-),score=28.22 TRINITY_DN816_c0_g1_i2:139-483(-)